VSAKTPRGSRWRRVRSLVLERDGYVCWLCGLPGANSVDHVHPVSLGGATHDPMNLRAAHYSCNSKRGNRTEVQRMLKTSRRW
jgi:5-methylcytosine-specific restriction endonuclease McrA